MTESVAHYAAREIADALYLALMAQPGPLPTLLASRAVPVQVGANPCAVRSVAAADPRFVMEHGRCDLRVRSELSSGGFTGNLERVLGELGRPAPREAVVNLFASATGQRPDHYERLLETLLEQDRRFCQVSGLIVPASWVLIPEGETEEDVLFYCELDTNAELAALREEGIPDECRGATPLDSARRLVRAFNRPISNRVLGFLVYRFHPQEFDALALLAAMLADPEVYPVPGLQWVPGEIRQAVRAQVERLNQESATPMVECPDLPAMLAEPLPPDHPGYFIQDDHLALIYDLVGSSTQPVSVGELLSEVLQMTPADPDFLAAAHSVHDLLHQDPGIISLGDALFLGPRAVPPEVREVPHGLIPVPGDPQTDVILRPEGLRPGLAAKVADPFMEDVGEDEVTVTPADMTTDETYAVLSYPHLVAGTLKLRKMDARFFRLADGITVLRFVDPQGTAYRVWANTETGLLSGLGPLYSYLQAGPGTLLALRPGEASGEFVAEAAGEDEASAIPPDRLEALLRARSEAACADCSLYDLTRRLMADHPEGVRFERLLAEINVLRRTTRLQLASLLSYYQCFRPRDSQGDNWAFMPDTPPTAVVTGKDRYKN